MALEKVTNMAFLPGLKKQINKANQFMSEKITGVEGTKLDDDFRIMEQKTDVMNELTEDIQIKTKEYLQPNPTIRAKMTAVKLSGQAKASTYPQPEGTLGDAMTTFGNKMMDFDNQSVFGGAMVETGESLKQMADLKYALDDNVKQNFLEPLHQLQNKDLKEVAHHRKKLLGRKLDYDCKKRRVLGGGTVSEKEIKQAEDKFAESLHLAQMGMYNISENDVEQISQLVQFADALLEYHKQCAEVLQSLTDTLYTKTNDASGRPKREFQPKTLEDLGVDVSETLPAPISERSMRPSSANSNNLQSGSLISPALSPAGTPTHQQKSWTSSGYGEGSTSVSPATSPLRSNQPSCQALYDFDAESPNELAFKEGDMINLLKKLDENWFEGSLKGKTGCFPINYVTVIVNLP